MQAMSELDTVFFEDAAAFEAWLEIHAETSPGLWIRMAKKNTGIPSLDWTGAVEVVLCFGWIDGQVRRVDDEWFVQRVTPRRSRSIWSKINRLKVEDLITSGRMRPAGLAEVERAKSDGRWDAAYDGMATSTVPDDLARELQRAGLESVFASLTAQARYAVLHGIQTARRAETRAARIAKVIERLAAEACL
jgi:uncharacterized protein YdeI (YjbR/CyaY-like superfamily)